MASIRKAYRRARCEARITPGGKWLHGCYKIREFKVTKAAARRRAKILGLPARKVPHGKWYLVVTTLGCFTVPEKQVR